MARKRIASREELAARIGVPPTTVRRSLDERWDGEVIDAVGVAVCQELGGDFRKIIRDPRYQ